MKGLDNFLLIEGILVFRARRMSIIHSKLHRIE